MNSARPWNTHTVPLRPGGGAQRANRSDTPSGVLSVPVTTSSGIGLAGIETSVMGCFGRAGRRRAASRLIAAARAAQTFLYRSAPPAAAPRASLRGGEADEAVQAEVLDCFVAALLAMTDPDAAR